MPTPLSTNRTGASTNPNLIEVHSVLWKVQLWLGDRLIEERIAPSGLAEQYTNVIRLRIRNLPGRSLRCEPVTEPEAASTEAAKATPASSDGS